MNNPLTSLILGSLLAASLIAPGHAAVIDQVKSKVDAIRADTINIKGKSNNLVTKANEQIQRLDEVASTVNSVIAETDSIKQVLEPLHLVQEMKGRLDAAGINPSEIIDQIPLDKIKSKLDEMKQEREALQAMLGNSGLAGARQDLLQALTGIRQVLGNGVGPAAVTPFQTLLETAPDIAFVPLVMDETGVLGSLTESVNAAAGTIEELRQLDLIDPKGPASNICSAVTNVGVSTVFNVLMRYQKNLTGIKHGHTTIGLAIGVIVSKVVKIPGDIGIHGYLTLRLSQLDPGETFKQKAQQDTARIEWLLDLNALRLQQLEWINRDPGYCASLGQM